MELCRPDGVQHKNKRVKNGGKVTSVLGPGNFQSMITRPQFAKFVND
jgi:hypothetical protein